MRVNVISDLHLEFDDLVLPGGDVLILSGDIAEAKNVKRQMYNPDMVLLPHERKRPDRYSRFFEEECAKYRRVLYVMGNHEHYGGRFDKSYEVLKENLPSHVTLLEKEYVDIDGVIFIGATFWTNCNGLDPLTMQMLQMSMNDYRVITNHYKARNLYYKLTPDVTVQDHINAKNFISETANKFADKDVVVVTHHSPSQQSIKPKYQHDFHMNGGYSSNCEEFITDHPNIRVWTHGHTHDTFDYMVGQCRILCNPRGYSGYEERAREFDPTIGFDI